MRYLLLLSFFLLFNGIHSQIVVTDINNKPIPYVEILSNNKHFYTQTNLKGEINKSELEKLNPTDTLFFKLITYETQFLLKSDLKLSDTIKLQERIQEGVQEIEEFLVVSNKKKYQKIDVCYRSYQVNDDSVAYYLDGKADFLSKIMKSNYDLLLKENRSFANKEIEDEDVAPDRMVSLKFASSIPRPPFYYLPYQYDNDLTYRIKDISIVELFNHYTIYVGSIETNKDYIKYSIADPGFSGTNIILKSEINRINNQITMIFRNYEELDVTTINYFDDLLYFKSYREYNIKYKKAEDYVRIIQVEELFLENVSYFETVDKSKYNSTWGMGKKSNYTTEFWKTCDCELYESPIRQLLSNLYQR
jgi:hypothetical protein